MLGVPPVNLPRWPFTAVASVVLVCAVSLLVRPLVGLTWETFEAFDVVAGVTLAVLGAAILRAVAGSRVGQCFLIAGACAAASALAAALSPASAVFVWLHSWLPWLTYATIPYALIHFPDGRLPGARWRVLGWLGVVGVVLPAAALALAAGVQPELLQDLDAAVVPAARGALVLGAVGILCAAVTFVASVMSLVIRWRVSRGERRQQLRWLWVGGVGTLLAVVAQTAAVPVAGVVTATAIPAAATVAVLRYRLYDLDLFVNRTLVYVVTSALLIGACAVLLPLMALSAVPSSQLPALVLTTGVLVLLVHPVRRAVQRALDRFLRGRHDDPHAVITSLTRTISRTQDPGHLLTAVVQDVAGTLKLPYVGIQLQRDGVLVVTTEFGRRVGVVLEEFPMTHQGVGVGMLLVARRSPGEQFGRTERSLLEDLARQAGAAANAARLTVELRSSRERLRRDLEEERRKLRHDLHDSLGPMLAGLLMQAGAAQSISPIDGGERTTRALRSLEQGLQQCIGEVRVLINGMHRPAVLDQVGLVGAVHDLVRNFATSPLDIAFRPAALPEVPAAVEVAAYRIVGEALANVVKHARAQNVVVGLEMRTTALLVSVEDDGGGLVLAPREGEGLHSMRERASELGGWVTIEPRSSGGTRVTAFLPVDSGKSR